MALALLALLLLVWWLWPAPEAPPPPPPPVAEAKPGAPRPPVRKAKPPVKKPQVAAAPVSSSQRALLMKAVEERAPQLKACPLPPGSPARLSTRIRIGQKGPVRSVAFTSVPPPSAPLSQCLRDVVLKWDFADLQLRSDVEVLVNLTLG